MSFIKIPTKPKLITVETLPDWAYSDKTLEEIRSHPQFGGYCHAGYYIKEEIPYIAEKEINDDMQ